MAEEGKVSSDVLFLGLTRSPTIFGVNYTTTGVNVVVCLIGFVMTNDIRLFLMPIFNHIILYYISSKEPLIFDLFIASSKCHYGKVNRLYHRASSYDPS